MERNNLEGVWGKQQTAALRTECGRRRFQQLRAKAVLMRSRAIFIKYLTTEICQRRRERKFSEKNSGHVTLLKRKVCGFSQRSLVLISVDMRYKYIASNLFSATRTIIYCTRTSLDTGHVEKAIFGTSPLSVIS